jgi:hypothetical protein
MESAAQQRVHSQAAACVVAVFVVVAESWFALWCSAIEAQVSAPLRLQHFDPLAELAHIVGEHSE